MIEIVQMENDELGANIKIRAERFPGSYQDEVERLAAAVKPTVSFR